MVHENPRGACVRHGLPRRIVQCRPAEPVGPCHELLRPIYSSSLRQDVRHLPRSARQGCLEQRHQPPRASIKLIWRQRRQPLQGVLDRLGPARTLKQVTESILVPAHFLGPPSDPPHFQIVPRLPIPPLLLILLRHAPLTPSALPAPAALKMLKNILQTKSIASLSAGLIGALKLQD